MTSNLTIERKICENRIVAARALLEATRETNRLAIEAAKAVVASARAQLHQSEAPLPTEAAVRQAEHVLEAANSCDALRMTHQGFVGGDGKGDGRRDLP